MENTKTENPPSDHRVTLRPLGGISPATYLTGLFILGCCVLFFALFILPGLLKNGTLMTVYSLPDNASLMVDDRPMGRTPCTLFLPAGSHTLEISRAFFEPRVIVRKVEGRRFASLFFPRKDELVVKLESADLAALLAWTGEELAAYGMYSSLASPASFPPLLQDAAAVLESDNRDQTVDLLDKLFDQALLYIDSPFELAELLTARGEWASRAKVFSPGASVKMLSKFITYKEKYPLFPQWLRKALSTGSAGQLPADLGDETGWIKAISTPPVQIPSPENHPIEKTSEVIINNTAFCSIPAVTYLRGHAQTRRTETLDAFAIAVKETTNAQYYQFVLENPLWRRSNLAALVEAGKATNEYLLHWNQDSPPPTLAEYPVIHVSWYAARAYVDWFATRGNFQPEGIHFRLPLEKEIEFLAGAGVTLKSRPEPGGPQAVGMTTENQFGVTDILGNAGEWCENWYYPCADTLYSPAPGEGPPGSEKEVRGGSWSDGQSLLPPYLRGSQPPSWCTPYTGFRLVIEGNLSNLRN